VSTGCANKKQSLRKN